MYDFKTIQDTIENAIEREQWIAEPVALYEPIYYAIRTGGKRLRPALLLMAANLFSDDIEPALLPALGIEIFHNFTLVHDDIMDNAGLRRNNLTVHKKWDANTAILSGDAMFIKSYQYLLAYEGQQANIIFRLFNQTALEVCEGQQYDINFEHAQQVSEQMYLNMIELKTAKLIACSLKMGGLTGGASEYEADLLYKLGIELGHAFQLQDDYLDCFGDPKAFGKKLGGDILADKKTYLSIKTYEKGDMKDKQLLDSLTGSAKISPEKKVKHVMELYRKHGVQEITAAKIMDYFDQALNTLKHIPVREKKKSALKDLIQSVMERNK
jgi:geranylgeranyl diphosphate synthase, type II